MVNSPVWRRRRVDVPGGFGMSSMTVRTLRSCCRSKGAGMLCRSVEYHFRGSGSGLTSGTVCGGGDSDDDDDDNDGSG